MTDTNLDVYNAVAEIISPVYLVGGAVRDLRRGVTPHDWDMATPLLPSEVEKLVRAAGRKPYLVGSRFGTTGLKVAVDGVYHYVEVTTFRAEQYHTDCRKPDVTYVRDITADLSRRDFTINAMALRGPKLIDPFGGAADLENGLLRAVGTPSHRFREDPLRILRLARFCAQFDFAVEEITAKHAKDLSHKILSVSRERWVQELDKLLVCDHVRQGLFALKETRLLNFMLPELALQVGYDQNTPHHDFTLWEHTCRVVAATPPDETLRWAALLHDIAKPFVRTERPDRSNYIKHDLLGYEIVRKTGAYLKWSKDRTEVVSSLVRDHLNEDSPLKQFDTGVQKRVIV
jgi:putative nucleotidyltransferase with HDIG domain